MSLSLCVRACVYDHWAQSVCDHWTQRKVMGKRKVTVDGEKSDGGRREKWQEKDETTVGCVACVCLFESWNPGLESCLSRSWNPGLESCLSRSWNPGLESCLSRSWNPGLESCLSRSWNPGLETQVLRAKYSNTAAEEEESRDS